MVSLHNGIYVENEINEIDSPVTSKAVFNALKNVATGGNLLIYDFDLELKTRADTLLDLYLKNSSYSFQSNSFSKYFIDNNELVKNPSIFLFNKIGSYTGRIDTIYTGTSASFYWTYLTGESSGNVYSNKLYFPEYNAIAINIPLFYNDDFALLYKLFLAYMDIRNDNRSFKSNYGFFTTTTLLDLKQTNSNRVAFTSFAKTLNYYYYSFPDFTWIKNGNTNSMDESQFNSLFENILQYSTHIEF